MNKYTPGEVTTITYSKDTGDERRRIIVSSTPTTVVRAIDVTDAPETEQELVQMMAAYTEYRDSRMKEILNFENWAAFTYNRTLTPKWRAFSASKIK